MPQTKLTNMVNPQVMADMISAKLPAKLVVSAIAKVDTTLEGRPGNTITIPAYVYIGDAADVAEGVACGTTVLTTTTATATVKKAMKAVELTDEAVLSGYGNPVGETNAQLAMSIASKINADAMDELQTASLAYNGSANKIAYTGIVDAIDVFDEEENTAKVIYINPAQVGTLRKDPNFLAADKVASELLITGAIGKIAGCEVVPSKKVPETSDKTGWKCPIVKITQVDETEEDAAALTIFLKKNVGVETERNTLSRTTIISADEHYVCKLTNDSKVVIATFKK